MSLLSPLSLLLALPICGIIVVLYLLKLKRKERVISSVLLWRDAVADIQANAPFQKLKKSLLLILQLAVALILIGAAARPFANVKGIGENRIVVIVDASASMQATDVTPSRFEAAKARATIIARDLGPGDAMLLINAASKPEVVASFTADKKALANAISALKPTDASCNMRQALVLAMSLAAPKGSTPARVVILSDGGFNSLEGLSAGGASLSFECIGKRSANVGITGLSSRKTPSGAQEVFVGLRNFSPNDRTVNVEMYLESQLADIRETRLKANGSAQVILPAGDAGGRMTVKLDITDDLETDNTGTVYLQKPHKVRVLMVSPGNVFLQNAVNLDTTVELIRSSAIPADFATGGYDITIFDRVRVPATLPTGGYLLISTSCPEGPAEVGEGVDAPVVMDSRIRHPAAAYVDFVGMRIMRANYLRTKPWASTIVEGTGGPLAVAGSRGGRRFVQIGWNLLDSNFPMRVGFPIFCANCVDWLAGPVRTGTGQTVRTGEPVYLDIPTGVASVTVETPDGRSRALPVSQSQIVFDGTEREGVYKVRGKGYAAEFAANVASSRESDLTPSTDMKIGAQTLASGSGMVRTNKEFYWPLVALALAVLVGEWYAFHRRL